jgi:meiotic recombination protein SPO11
MVRRYTWDDLRRVKEALNQNLSRPERIEFQTDSDAIIVEELPRDVLLQKIYSLIDRIIQEIATSGRPVFRIPNRSSSNIVYNEEYDLLLLGKKLKTKAFLSLTSVTDVTRMVGVLKAIHNLLIQGKHLTKRELFYGDVNLFVEQANSDACIEDVAAMLHTTRSSTMIIATARGTAVGRLKIRDQNDIIDLDASGSGGWSITPRLDQIEIIESDAEFLLVVEKYAALNRFTEDFWWRDFPCIIATAGGAGDMATRMFIKRLSKELRLPTYCLVDSDPYGHYIYSVFLRGSKNLSYESPFLATPQMNLLGVLCRDLQNYSIPRECLIPMKKQDMDRVDQMLAEPFVQNNPRWKADLELMKQLKIKAEIQAMTARGINFLTRVYIPSKLEAGDWI